MKQKTHKERVVEAICSFDLAMLDLLLSDEKTYQDVSKECFLSNMKVLFEKFQSIESMDKYLEADAGVCDSSDCSNKGSCGFRFTGNISNNAIDLIMEEKDGVVTDIFECFGFKCSTIRYVSWRGKRFSFDIREDEKVDYQKTPDYLIALQKVAQAEEDLKMYYEGVYTYDMLKNWVYKYKDLREILSEESFRFVVYTHDDFLRDYVLVSEIIQFYEEHQEVLKEAVFEAEYLIFEQNEIDWVIKYEHIDVPYSFSWNVKRVEDYFSLIDPDIPILDAEEFEIIDRFAQIYANLYNPLFRKYCVFSPQDFLEKAGDIDNSESLYRLSYHLNLREEYKTMGIEPPLDVY